MNQEEEKDVELTLSDIYQIIKSKFWVLVIFTIMGGILLGIYAFGVADPTYKSTGAIMVQVETSDGSGVNTLESQRLVGSTVDILTKIDLIPVRTSEKLKEKNIIISAGQIRNNFSVTSSTNSLVISLGYVDENPEYAKLTLDTIVDVLVEVTNDESYNMDKTLKDNISKLDVSTAKYNSPNKALLVIVGLLLGGIVGLVFVFISETVNVGFKSQEEIESITHIQVLGTIPTFSDKGGTKDEK